MAFIPNKSREFTDKGYINVLDQETNEVLAFPETMSQDEILQAIEDDKNGTITQQKPSFYKDVIRPALEASKLPMFQPTFLWEPKEENITPERAFFAQTVKDLSFGLVDVTKNPTIAASLEKFEGAAWTGSLVGQTAAVLSTAGIAGAVGALKPIAGVSKLENAIVSNFKIGAIYEAIRGGVDEAKFSLAENQAPDIVKLGNDILKSGLIFGAYGAVGTAIPSLPVGTSAIAGMSYAIAKMEGASEKDALLNAGVMSIFHVASNARVPRKENAQEMLNRLEEVEAQYIIAKAPQVHPDIAKQYAKESTQVIKETLTAEGAKKPSDLDIIEAKTEQILSTMGAEIKPRIQAKPFDINVKEQVKAGGKDVKESKVFSRAKELYGEELAQQSPEMYEPIKIADEMAKAFEIVEKNPKNAKNISLGLERAPDNVKETAVSIAYAEKLMSEGKYAEAADVIRSRSLRQTERGQEIVLERAAEVNVNDPNVFIQKVLNARMEAAGRGGYKFSFEKGTAKKAATEKIAKEREVVEKFIEKKKIDLEEAQKIIDSLVC